MILLFALRVVGIDNKLWHSLTSMTEAIQERVRRIFSGKETSPALPYSPSSKEADHDSWAGFLKRLRFRGLLRSKEGGNLRARDSFLVGMGLSSSCVSCMGGSILYPLLVYAGITSWYWGLLTLGLYSLCIAVPMIFIALGFYDIRYSLEKRIGITRGLRWASGGMLAGIAVLFLAGQEDVLTDSAFVLLGAVSKWLA
jgi:cytochrome c biogenesis protein CcdA